MFSLSSYSSCLLLLPRLGVIFNLLPIFSSMTLFKKAVPTQDLTNTVRLPSLFHEPSPALPWLYKTFQFSTRSVIIHESPGTIFKSYHVFLIFTTKCPIFSTLQNCASNVAVHAFKNISVSFRCNSCPMFVVKYCNSDILKPSGFFTYQQV